MGLETVSHIADLDRLNPTSGDPKSQGDDHLRNIKKALLNDIVGFPGAVVVTGTDGGAVNAYTVTPVTGTLIAYANRMLVVFVPSITNSGPSTINIGGLGAKNVLSVAGAALVGNDLVAGYPYVAMYNGTEFRLLSITKNYVDQLSFGSSLPAQIPASKLFSDGISASFQTATVLTSSTTYIAPVTGWYDVECIGASGGAGSGRRGAAGTVRNGGAGSGGGARNRGIVYLTSGQSVLCTVGAGGIGGAAVTTDNTNGNSGTVGGTTSFGNFLSAFGGGAGVGGQGASPITGGGGGGTASAGAPGGGAGSLPNLDGRYTATGTGYNSISGGGAIANATSAGNAENGGGAGGGSDNNGLSGAGGGSMTGGAGGGSGGSITAANVENPGTNGGKCGAYVNGATTPGGLGGAVGASGTANPAATTNSGDGGGGGGASATTPGAGAIGSIPGGGSGGSGATLNGVVAPAGANGARGEIRIRPL